ncbi:uncharacterized protein LOC142554770 [Primulina tabacum]|uniref:uncharacterized protein LOC142554770 n=1 Tax=Primulina tabacum TaxID=48773 RepID=UPI003F5AB4B3
MAEHRENDRQNLPEAIPIRDHFRPVINNHYSGIARGTINANNFELKPALINMVQQNQFAGTATSDPHVHLRTFVEITNTELATKFLAKYFHPAKSAQLKIEISTFRQTDFEQLYEAWERYKELLRKCLNHGFEDWVKIELFYNGLNGQTRGTVDAATGGTIFAKSPEQAYDLLEQMTINSYQWPSERTGVKRTAGVYAVDPITSITAQVSALTTQIATMNKVSTSETESPSLVAEEPALPEEAQYINNRNFGGFTGYRGEGKPSFEDLVGTFIAESGKKMNRGQFPSNTEVNPKEQCKAVTLRSEKELEVQKSTEKMDKKKTVEESEFEDRKEDKTEEFKAEVEVEQPPQMPNYAKFIKDVMSKKRKLQEFETVKLNEECNAILQKKLPQKLKDPWSFTVPCFIGGSKCSKALCDLRANMEEDHDTPLIFGRKPFLATERALIDVHKGELTLRVGGEAVFFNIYQAMKGSNEVSTCKSIDVIDSCMSLGCAGTRDPLERCLIGAAGTVDEDDWEVKEQLVALDGSKRERK